MLLSLRPEVEKSPALAATRMPTLSANTGQGLGTWLFPI